MKFGTLFLALSPLLLVGLLALPQVALGDVGDPLTLDIQPDTPVSAGDTITVTLSDGTLGHFAFLVAGTELGSFDLFDLTLDVRPQLALGLGVFGPDGTKSFSFTLPPELPAEISGLTLHAQGVSIGFDIDAGGVTFVFRKSNLDSITFN